MSIVEETTYHEDIEDEQEDSLKEDQLTDHLEEENGKEKLDIRALITTQMTDNLKEFLDLCKNIKAAKEEIKILSDRKTELEVDIRDFMLDHDIPAFKTPNGLIQIRQTKSVKPLNKDFLRETISTKISDSQIALELTELAFSNRPTTMVPKIRVVSQRSN